MTARSTAQPYVRFEDFLEAEAKSDLKHEWLDGVVYAMGGGSLEHSRIATNLTALLKGALGGRCTVFNSDAMVYVRATNLATYPDASVVCGPVERQSVHRNGQLLGEALVNPSVLVEVLSPSTESYDRGEKFSHYMRLSSLQEYVLVWPEEFRLEVHRRPEGRGHWTVEAAGAGGLVTIGGTPLSVDDLYAP